MRSFIDVLKDNPGVSDVHVASTGAGARRRRRARRPALQLSDSKSDIRLHMPILKTNDALQTVYGWASVIHKDGQIVTDHQDDRIEEAEMVKAAHDFVTTSRHGGLLHAMTPDGQPHKGGEIVESLVLTPDVQKALGIDLGQSGWFVGYHVADPDAWTLVKAGTLKAFSIGGRARRVPV